MKVGILGAGQLGRMLAHAGLELGLDVRLYDESDDPAAAIYSRVTKGSFQDGMALTGFARGLGCVTFEFENVPVAALQKMATVAEALPPIAALSASQDRLSEKSLLSKLGIPTAEFLEIAHEDMVVAGLARFGSPCVLKTRSMGYDGKGQILIHNEQDARSAYRKMSKVPLILEGFVRFEREVSLIGVRAKDGDMLFYPLCENHHEGGILRWTKALVQSNPEVVAEARRYMKKLADHLKYVGVLVIEFFLKDGRLIANEIAPRVHNSGHWTIEGSITSQFENHMRACAGLPLGCTEPRGYPAMVNLIGAVPSKPAILRQQGFHLHDYGKIPRPMRKVGHVTVTARSETERDEAVVRLMHLAGSAASGG